MTAIFLALAAQVAALPESPEGRWVNPARSVVMVIRPCGEMLCGTVEWASEKAKADALKGTGELIGAELLSRVKKRPDGRWQGRLFVPDVNKRVHAKIELLDDQRLKVSGCALGRILCKSQVWTRTQARGAAQ